MILWMLALALASGSALSLEPGDTVDLTLPDISYFPEPEQTRQFTCRAVTEHAYWLVQDTTFIDLPDTTGAFQLVWGNVFDQSSLDSITAEFEGAAVDVHGTVTGLMGEMPETVNGDDRIWMAFTDYRDYYPNPQTPPTRVGSWAYVWPEDFDGISITGNNHDLVYLNLGVYKNMEGQMWEGIRRDIRTWAVPTGLAQLLRTAHNRTEDRWVVRSLGAYAQHMCYGLTTALNDRIGLVYCLDVFRTAGSIELTWWRSGQKPGDFAENRGAGLLWMKYLEQREGAGVITRLVSSDRTGMMAVAAAVDSTVPDSLALTEVVFPVYEDWMIANLVSEVADGYGGGIYEYEFLEGTGHSFGFIGSPASFVAEFQEYPIPTWIAYAPYGMSTNSFAAQYVEFTGDYAGSGETTVYLNGMCNRGEGSGPSLDGRWKVHRIVLDGQGSLSSVEQLPSEAPFNMTFELEGSATYLALTNANPGGPSGLRFTVSQDDAERSVLVSMLQNAMDPRYLLMYASLYREAPRVPDGFDWVGPKLEVSLLGEGGIPDSTATVDMDNFEGTLWAAILELWSPGDYRVSCGGYDSLGVRHETVRYLSAAYPDGADLLLSVPGAALTVPAGGAPPGRMLVLCEDDGPILSGTGAPEGIEILAGPVRVPEAEGTLSFETTEDCCIYACGDGEWTRVPSTYSGGSVSCGVSGGGSFALAAGAVAGPVPGAASPLLRSPAPNPFSTAVGIGLDLPDPGSARLLVYDMSGRVVRELRAEGLHAGENLLVWDGVDSSASPAGAGMYICLVESGGWSDAVTVVKVAE